MANYSISLVLAGCGGVVVTAATLPAAQTPSSIQGTIDSVSGDTIFVNGYVAIKYEQRELRRRRSRDC
ncbi:hypothetical protein OH492_13905 [Vibrio chagasii]|nr:hypothetical protein [Vibrio chagasii]